MKLVTLVALLVTLFAGMWTGYLLKHPDNNKARCADWGGTFTQSLTLENEVVPHCYQETTKWLF